MILAGIDIGTNTLRLLLAQTGPDTFQEIHSDRRITRLGEKLTDTGRLSPEARKRTIDALAGFAEKIRQHKADAVSAVGTSALRNAENTAAFLADAARSTGLEIRVITGREEAKLTLLGVARALRGIAFGERGDPVAPVLVVDVGGGSTEMIATGPGTEPRDVSFPLGAVYLTERYIRHDPPLPGELDLLRGSIRKELDDVSAQVHPGRDARLIGTAGTITTLAAMHLQLAEYDPEKINRTVLMRGSIDSIVLKLCRSTLKARRTIPGLEHGREDIILAGSVVVQEIMERFGFSEMLVSDWGLREGIVFDLYEKLRRADGKDNR